MVLFLFKSMSLILQQHQDAFKMSVRVFEEHQNFQYLGKINTVDKIDELQKLNTDLIFILSKYFQMNIWA